MTVPFLRMARAPTRPEMASKVLVVRATCTMGDGPCWVQVPPLVAFEVFLAIPFDVTEASWRRVAAWVSVSGVSPASRQLS